MSAQSRKIDSLEALLSRSVKEDTTRLSVLFDLSWQHFIESDYQGSRNYAEQGLTLFNKLLDEPSATRDTFYTKRCYLLKAKLLYTAGVVCGKQGENAKALHYDSSALKIYEYYKDKKGMANCYNEFGNGYLNVSDYEKAKQSYLKSLNLRITTGDKVGMAASYTNIGNTYFYQGNYQIALKNYLVALVLKEQIGEKRGIISCYNNIANVYERIEKKERK